MWDWQNEVLNYIFHSIKWLNASENILCGSDAFKAENVANISRNVKNVKHLTFTHILV